MLHVLLLAQWIGFPEAGFQNWVDSLAPDALCHAFQDGLIPERYLPGGRADPATPDAMDYIPAECCSPSGSAVPLPGSHRPTWLGDHHFHRPGHPMVKATTTSTWTAWRRMPACPRLAMSFAFQDGLIPERYLLQAQGLLAGCHRPAAAGAAERLNGPDGLHPLAEGLLALGL